MNFSLEKSIELLKRSPSTYKSLLYGLSYEWAHINEGEGTWSAYDIIGHLIHGENTDWIPRIQLILSEEKNKVFKPFNRFAQKNLSNGKSIETLIDNFSECRKENLELLKSLALTEIDLAKKGTHPDLGEVSIKELIATWAIHDIGHLNQLSRVIVKHYGEDVGPWAAYSPILTKK